MLVHSQDSAEDIIQVLLNVSHLELCIPFIILLHRHSSIAFVQVGCGIWTLNPELANETEKDIFKRCLEREKGRKRKHRPIQRMIRKC